MRSKPNKVAGQKIESDLPEFLYQFLHHLPYYALLLDSHRQIIISNNKFLDDNDFPDEKELFGKGPGDIFQCENAELAGCGNSPNCRFCGIYKTLAECNEKSTVVSNLCRLIVNRDSFVKAFEFKVRCSPISYGDFKYFLLTLTDISAESRKLNLEKIFFHDVLNMVNGLQGVALLMDEINTHDAMKEYISIISNITERLSDTISSQRDIINAEKKELSVNLRKVTAREIIDSVIENSFLNGNPDSMQIKISMNNSDFQFNTDPVLLTRVLINMVKNAFEARNTIPVVTLGFYQENDIAAFFVHNNAFIEETLAKCIFQPNFSTKGNNRGLGTYSIRLIGENYLKGKVWFKTDPETGTTFTIELPTHLNSN